MKDALVERDWLQIRLLLAKNFGKKPKMEGILLLIGIHETNCILSKYEKETKQDLMHVAVCKLLEPLGFYEFSHTDEDGWPHWMPTPVSKKLQEMDQEVLLKRQIIWYFKNLPLEDFVCESIED